MPTDPNDPLSRQNIKDRYYGVNDPGAEKLLKRAQAMPHLEPPEDVNITTLYCGGLDENVTEADIKNAFYSFGELRNITLVPKQVITLESSRNCDSNFPFQGCAFVQFTQRKSAEKAAEGTFNKLLIKGNKITIRWNNILFSKSCSQLNVLQVGQVTGEDCSGRRHRSWAGEPCVFVCFLNKNILGDIWSFVGDNN